MVHENQRPQKMNFSYNVSMKTTEKERLSHVGDMSLAACAIRLVAARAAAGVSQVDVANAAGIGKTAYSNMETGRSFPGRAVMKYFFREHRIDFNFLIHGDFGQLPGDVQEALFAALPDANSAWDQRRSSDRDREKSQRGQLT